MIYIQGITTDALQKRIMILPSGEEFSLEIYFRPMQLGWFINTLTYHDFVLHGIRIVNNPNLLYQWKNLLPFGLACYSSQNREPSLAEDFFSNASQLYILDAAEVAAYTEFLQSG